VQLEELSQLIKSIDLVGNRACDIPACSTARQPTALQRVPNVIGVKMNLRKV
jgi:hypothetical protein